MSSSFGLCPPRNELAKGLVVRYEHQDRNGHIGQYSRSVACRNDACKD